MYNHSPTSGCAVRIAICSSQIMTANRMNMLNKPEKMKLRIASCMASLCFLAIITAISSFSGGYHGSYGNQCHVNAIQAEFAGRIDSCKKWCESNRNRLSNSCACYQRQHVSCIFRFEFICQRNFACFVKKSIEGIFRWGRVMTRSMLLPSIPNPMPAGAKKTGLDTMISSKQTKFNINAKVHRGISCCF